MKIKFSRLPGALGVKSKVFPKYCCIILPHTIYRTLEGSLCVIYWRREILTSPPPTEKINKNNMAVDPLHRYSNEAETANWDIYDDFKLEKTFSLHGLYKYISALRVLKGQIKWAEKMVQ